jgi:DNA polymerase V
MKRLGIHTAHDLADASDKRIEQHFNVVVKRTAHELRGMKCLTLDTVPDPRKSILTSRSFSSMVTGFDALMEPVAHFISRAAQKLRAQSSLACGLQVFLRTNKHKDGLPQYHPSITQPVFQPTNDTGHLIQLGRSMLKKIYRNGYHYKKAGIMLLDLVPADQGEQIDMMTSRPQRPELMAVMDYLNDKMGKQMVRFASGGIKQPWKMRCELRSPRYTTDWNELKTAKLGGW